MPPVMKSVLVTASAIAASILGAAPAVAGSAPGATRAAVLARGPAVLAQGQRRRQHAIACPCSPTTTCG
jgi:hypothetical protein